MTDGDRRYDNSRGHGDRGKSREGGQSSRPNKNRLGPWFYSSEGQDSYYRKAKYFFKPDLKQRHETKEAVREQYNDAIASSERAYRTYEELYPQFYESVQQLPLARLKQIHQRILESMQILDNLATAIGTLDGIVKKSKSKAEITEMRHNYNRDNPYRINTFERDIRQAIINEENNIKSQFDTQASQEHLNFSIYQQKIGGFENSFVKGEILPENINIIIKETKTITDNLHPWSGNTQLTIMDGNINEVASTIPTEERSNNRLLIEMNNTYRIRYEHRLNLYDRSKVLLGDLLRQKAAQGLTEATEKYFKVQRHFSEAHGQLAIDELTAMRSALAAAEQSLRRGLNAQEEVRQQFHTSFDITNEEDRNISSDIQQTKELSEQAMAKVQYLRSVMARDIREKEHMIKETEITATNQFNAETQSLTQAGDIKAVNTIEKLFNEFLESNSNLSEKSLSTMPYRIDEMERHLGNIATAVGSIDAASNSMHNARFIRFKVPNSPASLQAMRSENPTFQQSLETMDTTHEWLKIFHDNSKTLLERAKQKLNEQRENSITSAYEQYRQGFSNITYNSMIEKSSQYRKLLDMPEDIKIENLHEMQKHTNGLLVALRQAQASTPENFINDQKEEIKGAIQKMKEAKTIKSLNSEEQSQLESMQSFYDDGINEFINRNKANYNRTTEKYDNLIEATEKLLVDIKDIIKTKEAKIEIILERENKAKIEITRCNEIAQDFLYKKSSICAEFISSTIDIVEQNLNYYQLNVKIETAKSLIADLDKTKGDLELKEGKAITDALGVARQSQDSRLQLSRQSSESEIKKALTKIDELRTSLQRQLSVIEGKMAAIPATERVLPVVSMEVPNAGVAYGDPAFKAAPAYSPDHGDDELTVRLGELQRRITTSPEQRLQTLARRKTIRQGPNPYTSQAGISR